MDVLLQHLTIEDQISRFFSSDNNKRQELLVRALNPQAQVELVSGHDLIIALRGPVASNWTIVKYSEKALLSRLN